jgi:hypothetical protein
MMKRVYGPVLLATGWEYELPVRVLYDIPLGESRFGSWVRLMLPSRSLVALPLSRHCGVSGALFESGARREVARPVSSDTPPESGDRREAGRKQGWIWPISTGRGRGYAVTGWIRAAAGGDEGYTTPARSARPAGAGAPR